MKTITQLVWVIMSQDRKFIAKGIPSHRYLIPVDNEKDKKRILTYSSKKLAEAGFKVSGFYGEWYGDGWSPDSVNNKFNLEAVEATLTINL